MDMNLGKDIHIKVQVIGENFVVDHAMDPAVEVIAKIVTPEHAWNIACLEVDERQYMLRSL